MGSKLKVCLLSLLALGLFTAAPAWAQNGTITGIVTDGPSGRPLPDSKVDALTSSGRVAATTYTNASGRYSMSVPAGTYDVTVETLGYEPTRSTNVVVSAGGTARADIVLQIRPFQLNPVSATATTTTQ